LSKEDYVVGLTVAEEDATLLAVCEHGYGKRTPFGLAEIEGEGTADPDVTDVPTAPIEGDEATASSSSNMRYRRQRRGGKGLRDIKTTARNGKVVGTLCVHNEDHVLMIS